MARELKVVREGLLVGFVAYASVALFYAVFDFLAARGPALHRQPARPGGVQRGCGTQILRLPIPVDATAIFWYNALHLVLSLASG